MRILFGRDEPLLTSLGLWSRPGPGETNGSGEPGNGKAKSRARRSRSATETMAQWRLLVANTHAINGGQEVHLAGHGWSAVRLAVVAESYVAAEMSQQQQAQVYQAEVSAAKAAEITLRQWAIRHLT